LGTNPSGEPDCTLHADQVRVAASDPENGQYREYRVYRTSWVQSPTSGLLRASRADAVDHGPQGVRCNAIAPGWIDTELNTAFIEGLGDPEEYRASIGRIHPVGRTGKPDEVAGLARWLVSEESGFITGQTWTVDGGAQEPVKPSVKAARLPVTGKAS
jgi:NAD(P)-dependent dehydrogenase (short-subunit alcohol dehydrogenase family)